MPRHLYGAFLCGPRSRRLSTRKRRRRLQHRRLQHRRLQPQTTSGIWSGVYSDAQAKRGEGVANKTCVSCHGAELMGGEAGPTLVGLEFLGNWNSLSLGDFFDRIHTTMPADAPGSLTPQATSDLIAYVLKLNKYPAGEKELPTDMSALGQVKIEGQPPAK